MNVIYFVWLKYHQHHVQNFKIVQIDIFNWELDITHIDHLDYFIFVEMSESLRWCSLY